MSHDSMNERLESAGDPRIRFGESFGIAEGVLVLPLEYPPGPSHPPFTSTVFIVGPGRCTPVDCHDVAETWVILNGSGVLDVGGKTLRVSASDKLFFPSRQSHQVTNDTVSSLEILSVYWPVK